MRPEWFALSDETRPPCNPNSKLPLIPYDKMWPDDPFWISLLLQHKTFAGRVDFSGCASDGSGGSMVKYWFGVQGLEGQSCGTEE